MSVFGNFKWNSIRNKMIIWGDFLSNTENLFIMWNECECISKCGVQYYHNWHVIKNLNYCKVGMSVMNAVDGFGHFRNIQQSISFYGFPFLVYLNFRSRVKLSALIVLFPINWRGQTIANIIDYTWEVHVFQKWKMFLNALWAGLLVDPARRPQSTIFGSGSTRELRCLRVICWWYSRRLSHIGSVSNCCSI